LSDHAGSTISCVVPEPVKVKKLERGVRTMKVPTVKANLDPHAVGAGVVDSNPANNTDSVRVTVLEALPRLR